MNQLYHETHEIDVCVVGGGIAGLCAAVSAARNGAKTLIIQDRPMFGGNASSEVRMWICGAEGKHNKESGLVEEIQLENLYRNPRLNYPMWDHVMWEKARFQPNLEILLNCSVTDATMEDAHIVAIDGWQSTTQTWHAVRAKQFIDCSGDSILAAVTGAEHRWGREAQNEYGEDIEPETADHRTMGHSVLLQSHKGREAVSFTPPRWAYKFEKPEDIPCRMKGLNPLNYWWLELGGIQNTIRDTESIRDELIKVAYGVWDYMKNRAPEREKAAHWDIHWIGMYPGKRESRRYLGDHILTQNDVEAHGRFHDTVAYGGWTMDDHHPAGLLYPGMPTINHPAPSPYGIPYRSLYSRNIANLLCAGRNISVTHAALSSTRVMGTCAVIGQAAGTAAALCVRHSTSPRGVYEKHLKTLQEELMRDDCFLPGLQRPVEALTRQARLSGDGDGLEHLIDGFDRDRPDAKHAWEGPCGSSLQLSWDTPVEIEGLRFTFDSNLNNEKRMPCSYPTRNRDHRLPGELLRAFRIDARGSDGRWTPVFQEENNRQRLYECRLRQTTDAVRLVPLQTWGAETVRIFAMDALQQFSPKIPTIPEGPSISEVRAALDPEDLREPAKEKDAAFRRNKSA